MYIQMMDLQIVTCSYISVLLKNIGKMHYQIYVYSKRKGPLSKDRNIPAREKSIKITSLHMLGTD